MSFARARALVAVVAMGCAGAAPNVGTARAVAAPKAMRIVREPGKAALAIVTRSGDPVGASAAFVSTAKIGSRGAVVPVALAGVFEREGVRVTPQADGVRIVATNVAELVAIISAPITPSTDLARVRRKLAALGALPRVTAEELPIAACIGTLVPPGDLSLPSAIDLESWRAAAIVRERVAFGVVGSAPMEHAPALPSGTLAPPSDDGAALAVHDSTGLPASMSMLDVAWRGDLRVAAAARTLADARAPLIAMLAASDPGVRVRAVSAALSSEGACTSLALEMDEGATSRGILRAARAIALVTREMRVAIGNDVDLVAPTDAGEAAEQAALIALASGSAARSDAAPRVVVSVASPAAGTRDALARAIADATHALDARVVEPRTRIESGQPASWVLLASPCGTAGESDADAGASAAFVVAVARALRDHVMSAEPWIASDGVGVIASDRDAGKLADGLGRAFLVDPIEGGRAAQSQLLETARPGLAALAEAIAPGRPATVLPTGTSFGLLRISEAVISARAEALRRGPLRLAVIANTSGPHAEDAVARVDRWITRTTSRACPAQASATTPKPGTYSVTTDDGSSEVYIAAMVPDAISAEAASIASLLDGPDGLLAAALGDGLARTYGARAVGPPGGRAIAIHIEAPSNALDAAVGQVRALLDRMRQGAITDADLARSKKRSDHERAARLADPRQRLVVLFRDEVAAADPPLDRVRAAAATLRDDALVIVAARPRGSSTTRFVIPDGGRTP